MYNGKIKHILEDTVLETTRDNKTDSTFKSRSCKTNAKNLVSSNYLQRSKRKTFIKATDELKKVCNKFLILHY